MRRDISDEDLDRDLRRILDQWPVGQVEAIRVNDGGTNNRSRFVDTSSGSYCMRVYQNTADPDRVRYEHAILDRLDECGLSFQVPTPVASRDGETFVRIEGADVSRLAALFPLIPGRHPAAGDPREAELCGEALGELDAGLAAIDPPPLPDPFGSFADFFHVHPLVPDPWRAIAELPLAPPDAARLQDVASQLDGLAPSLNRSLPRRLIHADYGRTNTLMVEDRVTGILDFEFAHPDLRAMDLVCGLFSFVMLGASKDRRWEITRALATGYARRVRLTDVEVGTVPTLLLVREIVSLIHRIGRCRQGVTPTSEVVEHAQSVLRFDEWLTDNRDELLHHLRR